MEIFVSIIVGIVSSIAASFIFLLMLRRMRPVIEISPVIASEVNAEGRQRYTIKVINRGRRPAINIKTEFRVVRRKFDKEKSMSSTTKKILLERSEVFEIKEYYKKDNAFHYANRFFTYEEISNYWQDGAYLRFQLYATDSLSGFGRVFTVNYRTRDVIVNGAFEVGTSFEIRSDIN